MYHQHTYVVQHAQGNWASHLYKLETAKALILFPGEYRILASDYLRDGQSHEHEFEDSFELKTRQVYFIYPFPLGLKLSLLSEENLYFGKHFFGKTRTGYVYKTSGTTLCGWKEFLF